MGDASFAPRQYPGVMVSSTFRYLEQHRAALMRAIEAQGLHALAMEQDAALPYGTVIDSSLRKVRDAAAYISVISHRYGDIPESGEDNPERLSLTELEFREARRLGRPILIFIMGADHDVKLGAVERDPEKIGKLEAFREDVKRATADSRVQRVFKEFNNFPDFEVAAMQSVGELRRYLDAQREAAAPAAPPTVTQESDPDEADGIPDPPALYAEPRYIGSHDFVGRATELQKLGDWAAPADPHPVLLYEAIGGAGKSMLTWEWMVNHARGARADWAGQLWYSFYEKGAVMADFCRRALSYMTGQPLRAYHKKRQPELTRLLLLQLQARPWLLVLDGLERVLVAYHRYDAAQVADEEAGRTDEIARRDRAASIRPQDDELLRGLAGAAPSKILVTSRLVPRALLNQAGQPIPGVLYERLAGLRPGDAEALIRACGVHGDSRSIRTFLQQHCDCHPLVTGIVAGLVNDYLPDRGHFDTWAADPGHGASLNLAELDLVQKRNHILRAAMDALPDPGRQLLGTLALLSEAVDYETLTALNPHLPPRHEEPPAPRRPEDGPTWDLLSPAERLEAATEYAARYGRHEAFLRDQQSWQDSGVQQRAARELARTVRDLERRGLLQYDTQVGRYDLHPVVRGFASGSLAAEDRDSFGQRAVDYFSLRPRNPYEQAETIDDLRNGIQIIRTLLQMGRPEDAIGMYRGELSHALFFNLEAYAEILALLRPLFGKDWDPHSTNLDDFDLSYIANDAARAFQDLGQLDQALALHTLCLRIDLKAGDARNLFVSLSHLGAVNAEKNRLSECGKYRLLGLELAEAMGDGDHLFRARLDRFVQLIKIGRYADAEAMWNVLDPMGRGWMRALYRPGSAEAQYAVFRFFQGGLTEDLLARAEDLARGGRNRPTVRGLHALRGQWRLERGEWGLAVESLHEAVRMAREADLDDTRLETLLALARFRLGQLPAARDEVTRLASRHDPAHLALAELWHAIGEPERAAEHALAAYRWAWADGEPYVHRYELDRARAMLRQLGAEIPELPAYDPAKDEPLAFEGKVRTLIRELRAERAATGEA
jgi:Domain of unknown function (DUF4062)